MIDVVGHLKAIFTAVKYLFLRPITVKYPEERLKKPKNYRGVILLDMKKCIHCSLCARICPAAAIKMYKHKDEFLRKNEERLKEIEPKIR